LSLYGATVHTYVVSISSSQVAQEGHLIWALPLSIILVTICLVLVMGPTTLVGVAVLVLFVPVVQQITAKMLAIRNRRVEMTDERVGIVSAMLQGVSAVAVFGNIWRTSS